MVIHQKRPIFTILISLTAAAFIYLTTIDTTVKQDIDRSTNVPKNVKSILAYSLLKQIEIESEYKICGKQFNDSGPKFSAFNIRGEVDKDSDRVERTNEDSWVKVDGSDFHVFSIHVDRRLHPYHYIRIIGVIKGTVYKNIYCQFSSIDNTLYVIKVTATPIWLDIWDKNDTNIYFSPLLLSCRIPTDVSPETVALSTKYCDEEKKEYLVYRLPKMREKAEASRDFTVCVKPLDFSEDISERLIQWIEIVRILGGDKIEIYVKKVKKNVWDILKWYNSTYHNKIVIHSFKDISEANINKNYNFSQNLWQKRRYELIAYNSCFYKNAETSHFVIPLDIDEVIIPKYFFTWRQVLLELFTTHPQIEETFSSFMIPNAYFFGKNKKHKLFFFENKLRTNFSPMGESGKSFISTKNTLTVFNHYGLDVLRPGVSRAYFISSSVVQLNHYKEICNAVILPECTKYVSSPKVVDLIIFKYKAVFMKNYIRTLSRLQKLGLM